MEGGARGPRGPPAAPTAVTTSREPAATRRQQMGGTSAGGKIW